MFWVYILESSSTGRYYIGQTLNLKDRLWRHNHGESRSTKAYRPWKLAYREMFQTRGEAIRRERALKRVKDRKYLERLIENQRNKEHLVPVS